MGRGRKEVIGIKEERRREKETKRERKKERDGVD